MLSNGGSRSVLVRGALVPVLAAIVGVVLGHFLWSAASTIQVSPASSRSFGPFGYAGPGGAFGSAGRAGEYGGRYEYGTGRYGSGGGLLGPGAGSGENGNSSGEGASAESGSAGGQEYLSGLIQLNTDLQPCDSGGPLVNSSGEVLGMDTAASATFQFESSVNEGFAIPIDEVQTIAGQIREGHSSGTIHIGATSLLGVLMQSQSSEGALIENVLSGTPAAGSGLSAGSVIAALDGTGVSSPTALTELILQKHPRDSVRVTWRTPAGKQQTATVTLAEGPPE